MNIKCAFFVGLALLLPLSASISNAAPVTIYDDYIGADDHGWGDVIGSETLFDIHYMEIDLIGNMLSVDIYTNFAGLGHTKLYDTLTFDGSGIGYGDLFLSSEWTPFGVGQYLGDDYNTGTTWTYGFALDDRYAAGGGIGTLYQLNGNNNADALLSDDFLSGGTFRNGQEIAVDTGGDITNIRTGAWTVNADHLSFSFDISGTELLNGPEIAVHWGMTCGNDIIEGAAPVPEPSTMLLFGTGLIGLARLSRKRLKK